MSWQKKGYSNDEVDVFNFYQWELIAHDRSECLPFLEKHMSISIDLCTVQLGENIINSQNLVNDFRELLLYIRHNCPRAVLVVVGNFWEVQECDRIKMKVANELGVIWIDLMDIKSNKHFMAKLGTTVYDDNKEKHIITHDGVAMHPNDAAMYIIATKIYNSLKQKKKINRNSHGK